MNTNKQKEKENSDLELALAVIEDLLQFGDHEGPCTNTENPKMKCIKHLEAFATRRQRAEDFINYIKTLYNW